MQLPNLVAALIKAMGTFSPVNPAALHHLQPTHFSLPDPAPFPTCHSLPGEGDFTYLGMEAVSLVMLLLCGAWCRSPVSQKKPPCLKMYDHVQNTHTCLSGKQRPGAGTALTLPFVPSFTFPKLLRLAGRAGRVRRGWGPGLRASRQSMRRD